MQVDVQNTTVLSADGSSIKLGEYSGDVILVVNVASYCGNTAQYEDLQKLHDLYSSKGLRILAFPCNDLGNKNPTLFQKYKIFAQQNMELSLKSMKKFMPKATPQNLTQPSIKLNLKEMLNGISRSF